MRVIIKCCSLDLQQLTERDLTALIYNQTKRAELLACERRCSPMSGAAGATRLDSVA